MHETARDPAFLLHAAFHGKPLRTFPEHTFIASAVNRVEPIRTASALQSQPKVPGAVDVGRCGPGNAGASQSSRGRADLSQPTGWPHQQPTTQFNLTVCRHVVHLAEAESNEKKRRPTCRRGDDTTIGRYIPTIRSRSGGTPRSIRLSDDRYGAQREPPGAPPSRLRVFQCRRRRGLAYAGPGAAE